MTGNKIVLYKAPWNFSTLYQPYFMSDTARDSYLSKLDSLDVTPKNGNVNMHLDYNLELTVIIPVDITIAINFNFCKIIYNNKIFYSNILDYKQISVGYTELQLRRQIICEKTNFFQYFERFQISKATFSENFSYGKDTKFVLPTFRSIQKRIAPSVKLHTLNGAGEEVTYDTYYRAFYILYLDKGVAGDGEFSSPYGESMQYDICIIPVELDYNPQSFLNIGPYTIKYRAEGYFTEGNINNNQLTTYTLRFNGAYLDVLSPYIKAIEMIYMPIRMDENMIPFQWKEVHFRGIDTIAEDTFLILETTKLTARDSEGKSKNEFNEYFSFDVNITDQDLFGNLTLILGFDENRITFPIYEKKNSTGILDVDIRFLLDINGSSYQVRVNGDKDSVKSGLTSVQNLDFLCDYSFLLDQSSNFDAQNKYYNAMTRNAKRQKIVGGLINAGTEFALGGAQLGFAQKMGASGKAANTAMGVGNMLRGIGSIAEAINDVSAYENQRRLYRLNEKAKPDQLMSGDNALSRCIEWNGQISYLLETPFTEDYNSWVDDKSVYGIECDIHRNTIDFTEFSVDEKFFLQAIPVKTDNAVLTVQEYNEMYDLIKNGCRYFIVEEQESNKLDGGE